MSPARPGDPSQGRPAADEQAERAAQEAAEEAAAEASVQTPLAEPPEPDRPQRRSEPEAEGSAAAVTGVDKAAAEAAEDASLRAEAAQLRAEEEDVETPAPRPAPRRRDQRRPQTGVVVRAQAKYVRTSARKARLVCDHIRGKDVEQARAILAFTPRAAAEAWSKLLESAVANAEHNHELVGEELRILSVHADEGPTLKRFRPRAMGRATRIRKRTSHLTITLTPKE